MHDGQDGADQKLKGSENIRTNKGAAEELLGDDGDLFEMPTRKLFIDLTDPHSLVKEIAKVATKAQFHLPPPVFKQELSPSCSSFKAGLDVKILSDGSFYSISSSAIFIITTITENCSTINGGCWQCEAEIWVKDDLAAKVGFESVWTFFNHN